MRTRRLLFVIFAVALWSGARVAAPAAALQLGLISWWPAEGDATDVVNALDGQERNVAYAAGQVGLAFSFDGTKNTGVVIGDQPLLEGMPQLTVEAWVCTTDPSPDRGILTQHWSHENNTPSWVLRTTFRNDSGFASFGVGTTGGDSITNGELESLTVIADGTFHHLAGTYDGVYVRLYVDGLLEAAAPQSGVVRNSTNEVVIGNYGSGNHPSPAPENKNSFKGLIDEARVYNRALSLEEITDLIAAAGPAATCLPPSPNSPPIANAGADQIVECSSPFGTSVTLDGLMSSDPDGDPLTFTWQGPLPEGGGTVTGSMPTVTLADGMHTITLTVMDALGETSTDDVVITVLDTAAPAIDAVSASPATLWPPNHKMVDVLVSVDASDVCSGAAGTTCRIVDATSNEPDNGTGDGNTVNDIVITGDLTLQLRAERAGSGTGRVYTITVECADAAGNVSQSTTVVRVPKSQGKNM